jgi:hypothetical protein
MTIGIRKEQSKGRTCYHLLCLSTYHFILCNITSDYRHTFSSTRKIARGYFEGWAKQSYGPLKGEFMHGTIHLFIGEMYNFVWYYKYAHEVYTHDLQSITGQYCLSSFLAAQGFQFFSFFASCVKPFDAEDDDLDKHLHHAHTYAKLFASRFGQMLASSVLRNVFETHLTWKQWGLRIFSNIHPNNSHYLWLEILSSKDTSSVPKHCLF